MVGWWQRKAEVALVSQERSRKAFWSGWQLAQPKSCPRGGCGDRQKHLYGGGPGKSPCHKETSSDPLENSLLVPLAT